MRKSLKTTLLFFPLFIGFVAIQAQTIPSFNIAKLKYNGGGDWYSNKTSLPNLIAFCNQELNTNI